MSATSSGDQRRLSTGLARWAWLGGGWLAVVMGGIGILVPGLPSTVFFVIAASCFARSSPRFERWLLSLPKIGPMVADYRAGLGMRRRTKVIVALNIAIVVGLSVTFAITSSAVRVAVIALGLVGIAYVVLWVPTRERVLAERRS